MEESGPPSIIPNDQVKIVLLENIHARAVELLQQAGFRVETHPRALSGEGLLEVLGDAQVVGIRSKSQVTAEILEKAPNLWAVGCFCIGTNQVDLQAAAATGTVVFNAPFSNTRSVAELVISEIVALHRRLAERSMAMHQGRWEKSAQGCYEVRGRTLGIVGYGRIGSQVSILAEAMGLRVVYCDVVDRLPLGNAQQLKTLDELLEQADIVTLHVPATDDTRNMIREEQLARMKPGSYLLNNARGSVVDIDALVQALDSGHLAGAAVDVFPREPSKNSDVFESPLRGRTNVILTPHVGGSTQEAQRNIAFEVSNKLSRFITSGSTTTSVNTPAVELPDLHPDHHRILHYHRNVPGVLGKVHRVIGELGVNIAAEALQSNPRYSYMIMDVDADKGRALKQGLEGIEETVRVRVLY